MEADPIGYKGTNHWWKHSLLVIKVTLYEPLVEAESVGDEDYNIRTTDGNRVCWI